MCVTNTKLVKQLTKNVFVFVVALHHQQVVSLKQQFHFELKLALFYFFPVTVFVFVIVFLFVFHLYLNVNKYNV